MEKITKEIVESFLLKNEIELNGTHARLCIPIIDRIYRKMCFGIKFSGIQVENNLICDGHHRYLASLLAQYSIDRIPSCSTSATRIIDWKLVIFEEDDWDTPAKIDMLNEQDASFNNIPLEQLRDLLK